MLTPLIELSQLICHISITLTKNQHLKFLSLCAFGPVAWKVHVCKIAMLYIIDYITEAFLTQRNKSDLWRVSNKSNTAFLSSYIYVSIFYLTTGVLDYTIRGGCLSWKWHILVQKRIEPSFPIFIWGLQPINPLCP